MNGYTRLTDIDIPEVSIYAQSSEAGLAHYFEPAPGLFIAESVYVIERALGAGYLPFSALVCEDILDDDRVQALLNRLGEIPVYTGSRELLNQLTGFCLTGGFLCAMRRREPLASDALCGRTARLAVLEGVTNPTNVGAIFRSAAALGMDGVLLGKGCSDPLYRRCIRVSMGTVFQIPWAWAEREDLTGYLRTRDSWTVAMALEEDAVRLQELKAGRCGKLAILLGNEGYGLKPETIRGCDEVVMIPMRNQVDSLNVAAASAVVFWEICHGAPVSGSPV